MGILYADKHIVLVALPGDEQGMPRHGVCVAHDLLVLGGKVREAMGVICVPCGVSLSIYVLKRPRALTSEDRFCFEKRKPIRGIIDILYTIYSLYI